MQQIFSNATRFCVLVLAGLSIASSLWAAPRANLWDVWDASDESNPEMISHSQWQQILDRYLYEDEGGVNLFNYSQVSEEDKGLLGEYLAYLQALEPRAYSRAQQQAYWINLYNALTVDLVLGSYPIDSITKLGKGFWAFGPWNDKIAAVAGAELTLNDIEHRILRPIYSDKRVHFAVNCASIGCPNLQKAAFTAENTESLLHSAALDYVGHARGARFEGSKLILSSIFDWYVIDFGGTRERQLKIISEYARAEMATKILEHRGRVKYEYDWSLNDYKE